MQIHNLNPSFIHFFHEVLPKLLHCWADWLLRLVTAALGVHETQAGAEGLGPWDG